VLPVRYALGDRRAAVPPRPPVTSLRWQVRAAALRIGAATRVMPSR
jgi:hypothetical protein